MATAQCGKPVEGGGGVMAYPCVIEVDGSGSHDGPCMAYENAVSVSRRRRWQDESGVDVSEPQGEPLGEFETSPAPQAEDEPSEPQRASEGLEAFQGAAQTTAERYTEGATPPPGRPDEPEQPQRTKFREGAAQASPTPTCSACSNDDHADCDVFINEGAVDAFDFIHISCVCYESRAEWHDRLRGLGLYEEDQELPKHNQHPSIQDLVAEDVEHRKQVGVSRYGTVLQPFNGRDTVRDAYEEVLDLAIYLRSLRYVAESEQDVLVEEVAGLLTSSLNDAMSKGEVFSTHEVARKIVDHLLGSGASR